MLIISVILFYTAPHRFRYCKITTFRTIYHKNFALISTLKALLVLLRCQTIALRLTLACVKTVSTTIKLILSFSCVISNWIALLSIMLFFCPKVGKITKNNSNPRKFFFIFFFSTYIIVMALHYLHCLQPFIICRIIQLHHSFLLFTQSQTSILLVFRYLRHLAGCR